jgi:glycosyltransferase involved in cell wall biosynthesis
VESATNSASDTEDLRDSVPPIFGKGSISMDLSVILCTYNRSKGLMKTLESLEFQRVPDHFRWEIVVVDNNSADNTPEKVGEFAANSHLSVRYITEDSQGLSYARNRGITEAGGKYVHFIEDDEIADKHLVSQIYSTFETFKCDCVGGRIYLKFRSQKPSWLIKDLWGFLGYLDYGEDTFEMDKQRYPHGGNMAFSRDVFNRIGFFNVNMGRKGNELFGGEEMDLFWRLLLSGGKGIYQPKAIVYHIITASRMRKSYFRTLHYKGGMQIALLDNQVHKRSFFGIPFFVFPQFLRRIREYICAIFSDGWNNSFRKEMNICYFLGFMKGRSNVRLEEARRTRNVRSLSRQRD